VKHFFFRKRQRSQSTSGTVFRRAQHLPADRQEAIDALSDPRALFTHIQECATSYGDDLIDTLAADMRQGQLSQLSALWVMVRNGAKTTLLA
jgi:hypothetical protein